MNKWLGLIALLLLSGCSHKATYDNIMLNERRECMKLPGSAYDKCMEALNKSFEEYTRDRQEILGGENNRKQNCDAKCAKRQEDK